MNQLTPEDMFLLSKLEIEDVLEDVRLECARYQKELLFFLMVVISDSGSSKLKYDVINIRAAGLAPLNL